MEQKLVKIGNSAGVLIPKKILKKMGLSVGSIVNIEETENGSVIVRKVDPKTKTQNRAASQEFKKWLDRVMKEDGEVLDDLAVR